MYGGLEYSAFYDELAKIAEEVKKPKKSNLKRNLAIGAGVAGAALLGAGALAMRRSGKGARAAKRAAKAAQGAAKAGPKAKAPPSSKPSGFSSKYKEVDDTLDKLDRHGTAHKKYVAVGGPQARGHKKIWNEYVSSGDALFGKEDPLWTKRRGRFHAMHEQLKNL